jgi:hypothetical protein
MEQHEVAKIMADHIGHGLTEKCEKHAGAVMHLITQSPQAGSEAVSSELAGSMPEFFTMAIEPHTPTDEKNPCRECVLSVGSLMCMDRAYCRVRETGKTWKKKA